MTEDRSWTIRRATVDDAGAIALFHLACWKDAYRGIVSDDFLDRLDGAERTARWRRRLGDGKRSTGVAELAGTCDLVGVATWGPSHDPPEPGLPTLELASLYVARGQWGSGLASALMEYAIGGGPAQLWVFAANARARAFYAKHGFVPDGREQVDEGTGVVECRYVRR